LILENGRINLKRYWTLTFNPDYSRKEDDCVEELFEVLDDSVRTHMISDVPLGAFLSGGIDSSIVVTAMNKFVNQPVQTFSIGFRERESLFDERPYARTVAETFATDHREIVI